MRWRDGVEPGGEIPRVAAAGVFTAVFACNLLSLIAVGINPGADKNSIARYGILTFSVAYFLGAAVAANKEDTIIAIIGENIESARPVLFHENRIPFFFDRGIGFVYALLFVCLLDTEPGQVRASLIRASVLRSSSDRIEKLQGMRMVHPQSGAGGRVAVRVTDPTAMKENSLQPFPTGGKRDLSIRSVSLKTFWYQDCSLAACSSTSK